ncbi:hypothetical protein F8388_026694 [Cannabis sativa]|uniref:Phosphoinositide-specific phospholipase C EF-hand-like domain-containing protein n=1 Tax=Cannabis sativa TaxID=3483 RepID=A0A7J6H1J8_CANSA|nr:hypothetical protein F8388_026694 [Cannabis sativa]
MGSYRMCVCFTRKYRITEAEPPSDVKDAFKKFSEGGNHMNADQLRQFLVEFQGDDATTVQDAQQIHHRRHHHHIPKFRRHSLTLIDFHHYLFSLDFNPPIMDKAPQMDLSINNAEAVLERFKAVIPQSDRVYYNNVFRHLATSLEERQSQGGREEEPNSTEDASSYVVDSDSDYGRLIQALFYSS